MRKAGKENIQQKDLIDLGQKMWILNTLQQINDDISNDGQNITKNAEFDFDNDEISKDLSFPEILDEEDLFFDQKRERIKRKIEGGIKGSKAKDKYDNKNGSFKKEETNFIEKNYNLANNKNKPQTKRLNGMSVRINKTNLI